MRRNSSKYNTPSFRTRRYFSHHSYKDISLQHCSSLVGATLGTHIDRDISLVVPPRFVRLLRNNTAQSLVQIVEFGAQRLAALRLEVTSLKLHIPFTRTQKPHYLDEEQESARPLQNPAYKAYAIL